MPSVFVEPIETKGLRRGTNPLQQGFRRWTPTT